MTEARTNTDRIIDIWNEKFNSFFGNPNELSRPSYTISVLNNEGGLIDDISKSVVDNFNKKAGDLTNTIEYNLRNDTGTGVMRIESDTSHFGIKFAKETQYQESHVLWIKYTFFRGKFDN